MNRAFTDDGAVRGAEELTRLRELDAALPVAAAPQRDAAPVGVEALAEFGASWRLLERI